ncbi:MAG: periplasmic heavy metal sensor [Nitrospiraceae bacterium]|nr:periplasmic heavy metal sensor [Nitrospiraceae bacterium]
MNVMNKHRRWTVLGAAGLLLLSGGLTVAVLEAQAQKSSVQHAGAQAPEPRALAEQLQQLQQQVATLQAIIQKQDTKQRNRGMGSGGTMRGGGAMPMMDDQGEMGGMSAGGSSGMGMSMMDDEGEMAGMSSGGMSSSGSGGMGMMESEMGGMSSGGNRKMCCMGEMGGMMGGMKSSGMGGMKGSPSTMPGQPGASHLYHIGSTGFFLDHDKHLSLTPEQRMTLNRLKEKALLDRATQQRRIDQAEQDLYLLTGADQPDAAKIQAKVAEIEKLRADQRMNFIRAVGEATSVLTHDQHRALLGTMTSTPK